MNKNEYLKLREENSIELMYEYYKEHFDEKKHRFLQPEEFFHSIVRWPPVNDAYKAIIAYYDVKFEITKVQMLNTGNIIKVY